MRLQKTFFKDPDPNDNPKPTEPTGGGVTSSDDPDEE